MQELCVIQSPMFGSKAHRIMKGYEVDDVSETLMYSNLLFFNLKKKN